MPILILCTGCNRKLRVQDHLLGKTVKCPHCQNKFPAVPVPEPAKPEVPGDDLLPTPVVPPLQTLQLAEPASTPPTGPPPTTSDKVSAEPLPAPPSPPPPPVEPRPFESPALKVFAVVAIIVLVAALVGFALGWSVGAGVESVAAGIPSDGQ
jgi:hypothetical protein